MKCLRFVCWFAVLLLATFLIALVMRLNPMVHAGQASTSGEAQKLLASAQWSPVVTPGQTVARQSPAKATTGAAFRLGANRFSNKSLHDAQNSLQFLFLPAVDYPSGVSPNSLVVADANGDGHLDLVVADGCQSLENCATGGVSVLFGNGDGTFQSPTTYSSGGTAAQSVAVADVNGDGKPDVVVVNCIAPGGTCGGPGLDGNVGVLLGNGDGTFQPVVTYSSGGIMSVAVAVADLNGDGYPDIVVTNWASETVGVLLGDGDGTFQSAITYGAGYVPQGIAIADVNGDGHPDLITADLCLSPDNCNEGAVNVLLGNGDGTFQTAVTYDSGGAAGNAVVIGDVNGDGHPDVIVLNGVYCSDLYCGNAAGVLLNNGDGTMQPAVNYITDLQFGSGFAIGDVNGDGYLDLVNGGCGGVTLNLGNGDGTFQTPVSYFSGEWGPAGSQPGIQPNAVAIADVNGDGKPDLLAINRNGLSSIGTIGVLLNNNGVPPSTTSLIASLNPADVKQQVTYTATVAIQSGGAVSGTITFADNGGPVSTATLENNKATFSTAYTVSQTGAHTITASYSGALHSAQGSESAPLTEYVRIATSKTVLTSSGSPSVVGQSVTFTATVTSKKGAIPNGELVTFYENNANLGVGTTTNGVASLSTTFSKAKTYNIKATYSGDNIYEPSSHTVKQVVDAVGSAATSDTAITLAAAARPGADTAKSNPSYYEPPCPSKTKIYEVGGGPYVTEPFNLGATANMNEYCHNVYHSICTGKIFFYLWDDGGWNSLGPGTYQGNCAWQLTTTALPVGNHRLKALYTEDQDGFGPSSALSYVDVETWPTNTTLTSSPNPSSYKEDVTFTATAVPNQNAPTMPTGKIRFLNGGQALGTAVVNSDGVATLTTKRLPIGTDSITAEYLGDGYNAPSAAALSQVVNSDSEPKKAASDNR